MNEPIQIDPADPERYNSFYPRWVYDRYREILAGESALRGWDFLNAWDLLAPQEFTNSPLHRSPAGEALFASTLSAHVQQRLCP